MPILIYAGAGAALLYLAGRTANQAGDAAEQGADFMRTLVLLLGAGAAAVYLPRLLK